MIVPVMNRKQGKWYPQTATCDEPFVSSHLSSSEIADLIGEYVVEEEARQTFKLVWEPLKNHPRNLMVSTGNSGIPGRLHIVIPTVVIRSKSAIRWIENIIKKDGSSFLIGRQRITQQIASQLEEDIHSIEEKKMLHCENRPSKKSAAVY